MLLRSARDDDADPIAAIYNYYVENAAVTFEEEPVSIAEMQRRIHTVRSYGLPWLVAEDQSSILGYAYATRWKERSAYRYTVESTVYVSDSALGRGVGTELYCQLLDELKQLDVNVVIGGITLPNPASISLHEKLGMQKVAHFPNIGYKFGQWRDVGYWQLTLRT